MVYGYCANLDLSTKRLHEDSFHYKQLLQLFLPAYYLLHLAALRNYTSFSHLQIFGIGWGSVYINSSKYFPDYLSYHEAQKWYKDQVALMCKVVSNVLSSRALPCVSSSAMRSHDGIDRSVNVPPTTILTIPTLVLFIRMYNWCLVVPPPSPSPPPPPWSGPKNRFRGFGIFLGRVVERFALPN
jgi:hypothetical protein